MTMTLKAAIQTAGKVSNGNSKMPGSTFPISARECLTGSKLAEIEGSTCSRCYALKLQKLRPSVDKGWTANYLKATTMIRDNPEAWAKAAHQALVAYTRGHHCPGLPGIRWRTTR